MVNMFKNAMLYAKTKAIANKGTAVTEYVILIAIIVLAVAAALILLGNSIKGSIQTTTNILDQATCEASGGTWHAATSTAAAYCE